MLSLLSMIILLQIRLDKEQEEKEKRRKEKLEARLYTIIKVARDEDLGRQIGKEIYFDLVNHDKVPTFRILKRMPFTQFKEIVAKTFGIPVRFQRYWLWLKRKNHTYRPNRALTAQEEIYSVDQLREQSNTVNSAELKLFLEVELCLDLRPLYSPGKTKILLFFKLYDPLEEKIRYVGRLFVKESGMLLEILSELKEMAGFSPDEEIDLFEEIKFEPSVYCEQIDSMLSFRDYQLVDGDIICFQKSLRNQCTEKYRFPVVPLFLEYMHNHQARAKKEQEEMAQNGKEKAEACLYTTIKVARDADLGEQIGGEICFDLVDHDKVLAFHIQKQMPFTKFKEEVAKALGIPVEFQRYWLWAKRQNHTYRPDRALTSQDEIKSVGQLREELNTVNNELKLFLEVALCLDLRPLSSPGKTKEEILLFFKLYDPLEENIRYVGRLFVKLSSKPLMIIAKLKDMAGFSPDEEIELFEEIKFEPNVMCVQINSMLTFRDCKLYDGDIVCFQKSLRNQCSEQYRFPDVPSFLEYVHKHQVRLKKKQEEKVQKGKEKAEACLYTMIKIARDEDLGEQIGKEIYFDLVDHDKVRTFCIQKQMLFTQFKEEVAKAFGIPVQFQRYWLWIKRPNHTYRPDRALTAQEEIQPVGELRDVSNKWNNDELKLFLEVELCLDLRPLHPPGKTTREEILLFLKLYDPLKETIRYVGHLFVKGSGKPLEIQTKLKELAGFLPDEEIELFEEIRFEPRVMCEKIDGMLSFCECQLGDGDIICFQKSLQNQCSEQYRFPEVPSFLEYLRNHQPKEHKMLVPSSDFPTKMPQPVEVAPVDTAITVDVAESRLFRWTVYNFSRLNVKKLYSEAFSVGGYKWRILMFPEGNNKNHLSIYLDVGDSAALPTGWSRYAQFSLAVLDHVHGIFTVRKDAQHQFNARETDWGFSTFIPLTELHDPGRGYLVDDKIILEALVSMPKNH